MTTDVPGWSGEYLRGGSQCLRVGKNGGSDSKVTTPEFTLNGEAKLTFRAAAWNDGSGTTLKVSASNGSLANSEFTMPAGAWGDFSTTIKGNGKMKLTFQGELRYFLDQVFVTDPGTTGIENVEMNTSRLLRAFTLSTDAISATMFRNSARVSTSLTARRSLSKSVLYTATVQFVMDSTL